MSKAPLKQLSVNTFERTRIVSPKKSSKESNIQRKKVEEPHDERYWRTMAEFYRTKLDEITRENQQVKDRTKRKFVIRFSSFSCTRSSII